jgi:hypothetical protein
LDNGDGSDRALLAAFRYISEKLFIAFVSGVIPIYYGTTEVFDVFNKDAFVYWDMADPQKSLDQIQHLDQNQAAYDAMLALPYLAHGQKTVDQYFSVRADPSATIDDTPPPQHPTSTLQLKGTHKLTGRDVSCSVHFRRSRWDAAARA